jgi:hypothetical protein
VASLFDVIEATVQAGGGPTMPDGPSMPAQSPQQFQRPRGLRNTFGQVMDLIAGMGGQPRGYSNAIRQQEQEFEQEQQRQQYQNALANAMRGGGDIEALIPLAQMDNGLAAAKTVRDLTAPPREGSQVRELAILNEFSKMDPKDPRYPIVKRIVDSLGVSAPIMRGTPGGGTAIVDPMNRTVETLIPGRAPAASGGGGGAAPSGYRWSADGNLEPIPGGPAARKGAAKPGSGALVKIADTQELINSLKAAEAELTKGGVTGRAVGATPEALRPFLFPRSMNVQEQVAAVTQRNLKEILGGQFARIEGEQLINRGFNPALSDEVNLGRVRSLRRRLEAVLQDAAGAAPTPSQGNVIKFDAQGRRIQ